MGSGCTVLGGGDLVYSRGGSFEPPEMEISRFSGTLSRRGSNSGGMASLLGRRGEVWETWKERSSTQNDKEASMMKLFSR